MGWGLFSSGNPAKSYPFMCNRVHLGMALLHLLDIRSQALGAVAAFVACIAGDTVNLQVQLVNTGNLILQGVAVTLSNVTNLVCKSGDAANADSLATTTFTAPAALNPGKKLVCTGSFLFDQAAVDVDQPSLTFTPSVADTTTPTAVASTASTDSYAASTTVTVSAAPALLLTVNAVNCVKPSIIPTGDSGAGLVTFKNQYHSPVYARVIHILPYRCLQAQTQKFTCTRAC